MPTKPARALPGPWDRGLHLSLGTPRLSPAGPPPITRRFNFPISQMEKGRPAPRRGTPPHAPLAMQSCPEPSDGSSAFGAEQKGGPPAGVAEKPPGIFLLMGRLCTRARAPQADAVLTGGRAGDLAPPGTRGL